MASWKQWAEWLFIVIAFTFLLNILVTVPIILCVYLLGIKNDRSTNEAVIFEPPDGVDNSATFLEGIQRIGVNISGIENQIIQVTETTIKTREDARHCFNNVK